MKPRVSDAAARARRAALRALGRARRTAAREGVTLSEWEDEFIGSVEDRLDRYGRAFADPEKGVPGAALSAMQTRKLKEITAKAKGEPQDRRRSRFQARPARSTDEA